MSISILEACRKRKRRPKIYGFHTFADSGCPISPVGPFRDNVRMFLRECAQLEDYNLDGMPIWCTLLVHETQSFVVPLYTIEEDVMSSNQRSCDQCRSTGWSKHFLSKRKYHVIIPIVGDWNRPLEVGIFDLHTHLLHGLIHSNGFGHLLCINGIEGGSKYLSGREIMDLWDRICTNLRVRKMTVEDVSKKKSMDLRLLHGVAYGHPWFGRWGYKFSRGSFGVTEQNYNRAIEILSSLELDTIVRDFSGTDRCREIKRILRCYRDMSETQLITLRDILRFMLTVKSCASIRKKSVMAAAATPPYTSKPSPQMALRKKSLMKDKSTKCRRFSTVIASMDSRWSRKRLESAAEVIVNALKENNAKNIGHGGMSRQDVRDAARMHIGDTGLLDYVLKAMHNVIVESHIVHRAVNPTTRLLEYTIRELNKGVEVNESEQEVLEEPLPPGPLEHGTDIYREIAYLYVNVLLNYPAESGLVSLASQAVLDSKHFVKDWPFRDEAEQLLTYVCQVMPSFLDVEAKLTWKLAPGELVMVPLHAPLLELKRRAEFALRDTYCIMENIVITEVENMEEMEDEEVLFGVIESGSEVWFRGTGIDPESELRFEGGDDSWLVKCECGAEDDDGERMVACDICEVWQHTRCHGIEDSEIAPPLFVCQGCCTCLAPLRAESAFKFESIEDHLLLPPAMEFGAELTFMERYIDQ
ncbi:hypothetical protein EZV62_004812 [Acer yangbiense]|uniref:Zinc finger PHD-type domain-containing protein n=1 Tax=Acer yangbiense TaxID=1000413 RepID=A0A5C7IKF0_9ROSI|nr:hypothetical protein EZV62_004812 [Acer yangbiense]